MRSSFRRKVAISPYVPFQSGSEIVFSVADHGPGIPKEDLPHLIERYWQVKETAHMGHGLGLAIAKGIVDSHGGRVWVESEFGMGATFFTLPISDKPIPIENEVRSISLSGQFPH